MGKRPSKKEFRYLRIELDESVDMWTAFNITFNHWAKMNDPINVMEGTVEWYFSPEIFGFMPYYPYEDHHKPLLGKYDWLYFCTTQNGVPRLDEFVMGTADRPYREKEEHHI